MKYGFYGFIGIGLILFQTSVCWVFSFHPLCYDLLLPLIMFAGIYRPAYEGVLLVPVLGFFMDQLSGAPFGLYLTTYFWLYLAVILAKRLVHVKNLLFLMIVSLAAVGLENTLAFLSTVCRGPGYRSCESIITSVGIQAVVAAATAPLLVLGIRRLFCKWNKWVISRFSEEQEG